MEKLESDWSDGDSDKSYPLHPLVGSLQHNVMVSSAEAIRIWLAVFDDEIIPIDIGIEESPIYLPVEGDVDVAAGLDDLAVERDVAAVLGNLAVERGVAEGQNVGPQSPLVPRWDSVKRTLWVGDKLIKRYPQPSKNQVPILEGFQEISWADEIDDPLRPAPEIDSKKRLNDTVRGLNMHHKTPTVIHFYSANCGQGVAWGLVPPAGPKAP
jgi:hypothetical protein